jgi:hypothetical protein
MVRAILDGSKTQTRRIVKPQPENLAGPNFDGLWSDTVDPIVRYFGCPYGVAGDRLWVRETWMPRCTNSEELIQYRAGGGLREFPKGLNLSEDLLYEFAMDDGKRWRPSIHMPRWASRITLEITGVRVERLQEISEADLYKEGIALPREIERMRYTAAHWLLGQYRQLWDSLYGKGAWERNPWVWVIEFRRAE